MKNIFVATLLFISFNISLKAQDWQSDIEKAKSIASQENRNIVLVFQGSDWCAPCMKLEKEIWNTDEFKSYAKENFVMLLADFPKRKQNKLSEQQQEKNNLLAEKYNKQGYFPLVLVLDKDGNVLGKTGYNKMSPAEYIDLLSSY